MPARVIGCKSTTRGGPAGRTLKWEQKEKKKFSREESQHCSKRQDPEQENAAAPRGWGPFFLFSLFSFLSFSDSLLLFHRLNRISQTEKKKEMEYFYRCASSLARLGSALPVAALNSSNCSEPLSWTTTPGPSLSLYSPAIHHHALARSYNHDGGGGVCAVIINSQPLPYARGSSWNGKKEILPVLHRAAGIKREPNRGKESVRHNRKESGKKNQKGTELFFWGGRSFKRDPAAIQKDRCDNIQRKEFLSSTVTSEEKKDKKRKRRRRR